MGRSSPRWAGIYAISHITLHTTFKTLSRALKGLSARLWVREDRQAGGGQQDRRPAAVRTSSWPSAGSGAHRGGTRSAPRAGGSLRHHAAAKRCCLTAIESSFHSIVSQPPATHRVQPMVRLHALRLARCEHAQQHIARAGTGWQAHLSQPERRQAQRSRSCPRPRVHQVLGGVLHALGWPRLQGKLGLGRRARQPRRAAQRHRKEILGPGNVSCSQLCAGGPSF